MNLSPKALSALTAIKKELISTPEVHPEEVAPLKPKKRIEGRVRMRHARTKGMAFQRMCQRHDRW